MATTTTLGMAVGSALPFVKTTVSLVAASKWWLVLLPSAILIPDNSLFVLGDGDSKGKLPNPKGSVRSQGAQIQLSGAVSSSSGSKLHHHPPSSSPSTGAASGSTSTAIVHVFVPDDDPNEPDDLPRGTDPKAHPGNAVSPPSPPKSPAVGGGQNRLADPTDVGVYLVYIACASIVLLLAAVFINTIYLSRRRFILEPSASKDTMQTEEEMYEYDGEMMERIDFDHDDFYRHQDDDNHHHDDDDDTFHQGGNHGMTFVRPVYYDGGARMGSQDTTVDGLEPSSPQFIHHPAPVQGDLSGSVISNTDYRHHIAQQYQQQQQYDHHVAGSSANAALRPISPSSAAPAARSMSTSPTTLGKVTPPPRSYASPMSSSSSSSVQPPLQQQHYTRSPSPRIQQSLRRPSEFSEIRVDISKIDMV